jgi:ribonuclease HII
MTINDSVADPPVGGTTAKHNPSLQPCLLLGRIEAGCDEAGRGCLAGPVVAAAVILPPGFDHPLLNDSKQLSEKTRNQLRSIIEAEALAWAVGCASPAEIDEINILNASFLAMNRAIKSLSVQPAHLLIDGNRFRNQTSIPYSCIVKGDAIFMSIAAASVLAKTYRDELMGSLHRDYPFFGWNRNKGYPTGFHRQAIVQYGIAPWHRKSFRLTNEQLKLW